MNKVFVFSCLFCLFILGLYLFCCEPLVNKFEDVQDAQMYSAKDIQSISNDVDTLKCMTWNIRYGGGRIPWFGDCCGDKVILAKSDILENLQNIADLINEVKPDILFMQEVDVESKRTGYIDEVQWLLDHTYFNYGCYASMWEAQYVPSDGLGRVNTGNAILSRWKIESAERIQLPLRGDQDALTQYFYLRRNMLKAKIELQGLSNLYILAVHMAAFSMDDTKQKQMDRIKEELDALNDTQSPFILGGDFNLIPPGSDSTDFCDEDKCPGESFHGPDDDPLHREGSYFTLDIDMLQPLYSTYSSAVPLADYLSDQGHYFTHTPDWNGFWNRKLDYMFTNLEWIPGSDSTYQEITFLKSLSDHVAVSAKLEVSHGN